MNIMSPTRYCYLEHCYTDKGMYLWTTKQHRGICFPSSNSASKAIDMIYPEGGAARFGIKFEIVRVA